MCRRTRPACAACSGSSRFPGGIPSHVAAEVPGSIHEGGELGYSLAHAYGAAFDNPDLTVCCVVGDGEAETGALATSWHSNKFLNPARDGAVLPILHLNGYKIAGPTVLARIPREELEQLLKGYGYEPYYVEGHEPSDMHRQMSATLDKVFDEIAAIQSAARDAGQNRAPGMADDRARQPRRAGPARRPWMGSRSKARSARTRCRWARWTRPSTSACSKTGCAATAPTSCSTSNGSIRPIVRARHAKRRAPHEREPACERRHPAARPAHAAFQ